MNYIQAVADDIRSRLPDSVTSHPDSEDTLYLIYAVLAYAKGEAVTGKDVHDAWAAWMGERKPDHPDIVPYDQLTPDIQALDEPFAEAIRQAAKQM